MLQFREILMNLIKRFPRRNAVVFFFAACLLTAGCNQPEKSRNVIVEKRAVVQSVELSQQFLKSIDTSSESAINQALVSQDSLTLDGTTLIIGPVGSNRSVMLTASTLRLINGASIITNGNQLSLVALNMEFNNSGGISSFAGETTKAGTATHGADGGRVEIYATKQVAGSLRLSLAGQSGGDGIGGAQGTPGKPGDRGSDAADKLTGCGSSGGNGGPGGDGGKGSPGGPGAPGGNGGDLVLQGAAVKDHESHFPYQAPPGNGGAGGPGGPGGTGGAGGQAGNGSHFCGTGVAGNSGQSGSRGDAGSPGPSGTRTGTLYLK